EEFSFTTESGVPVIPIESYNIDYMLYGGLTDPENPKTYTNASETFTLTNPTKPGYTFIGWTGSNGDVPQTTVTIAQGSTGDKAYTANWAINSYRLDIGKGTGINTVTGDGMYEYNEVVTASCTMLDGYEFVSWSGDLTTEIFNMPANNATMTANARLIFYNITYDLAEGVLPAGLTNPTNYDITSATIVLNEPTKEGYTFLGWTVSNGNTPEKPLSIVQGSKSDLNFVANWSINSYRLDLVKSTGINTVTGGGLYEYNSSVTASCTMLDGYEFVSWSGDLTAETFNMPANNATMTANATPIIYSITYTLGDGATLQEGKTNPSSYDITSSTITLNNPIKDGYTFRGWTGTGIEDGTASKTVTIPIGSTGERSYVASWTEGIVFTLSENVTLKMKKVPNQNYYAGIYEVTQAEYFAVMGTNPSYFIGTSSADDAPTTTASYPVERVSWNTIMQANTGFIAKINTQLADQLTANGFSGYVFNLPTQAQWEYTCRAGSTGDYCKNAEGNEVTDSTLGDYAWFSSNSSNSTHSVGSKNPNLWGFYDMHGNVYEWCSDVVGSKRAVRGGNWDNHDISYCRSSREYSYGPDIAYFINGFRLFLFPGN
ncbi:MAG: SUMF1/EgtB/PvdO family nonheme iron enzyme, partial [Candidatus Riflebacteria bacterium]|nr:SUMF1/EgtB/PvdO family nonheme iron enzyme [Candidatus Riflebacteria bacterium]